VSKEGLETEPADKAAAEEAATALKDVTDFIKAALGEKVEKVSVSTRLTDSPCALVTSKFGWSANMERIMRTQTMGDPRAMDYMKARAVAAAHLSWAAARRGAARRARALGGRRTRALRGALFWVFLFLGADEVFSAPHRRSR